jgi:hypothetical protein
MAARHMTGRCLVIYIGRIVGEMKCYIQSDVKKERNILHTTKRRKDYWIGHFSRRNYFLNSLLKEKEEGLLDWSLLA